MSNPFGDSDGEEEGGGVVVLEVVVAGGDRLRVAVDSSMTVGEVKLLLDQMGPYCCGDEGSVKLNYRGKQLTDNRTKWKHLSPHSSEKLYAFFVKPGYNNSARTTHATAVVRSDDDKREERRLAARRAAQMEPFLDAMTSNPQLLEMILASSPEMRQMVQQNPEIERELRNPEVLKAMMRSSYDPDAMREMSTSMNLQLSQVRSMPGGAAAIERAVGSILRDQSAHGPQSAADLRDASEMNSKPSVGQDANTSALPNPWTNSCSPIESRNNRVSMTPSNMVQLPLQHTAEPTSSSRDVGDRFKYRRPLAMLRDMGFVDEVLMLEALRSSGGDVDGAVDYIASRNVE